MLLKINSQFHLIAFTGDEIVMAKREIAKLLQEFIENSTIGEYKTRLELIEILFKMNKECNNGNLLLLLIERLHFLSFTKL